MSSTVNDLMPTEISDQGYWEEVKVNGTPAMIKKNQSTQQTIFWHNESEGFYAFLETIDTTVDLVALAESVGPGPKMEVSKSYLGPDYTIELEQEPTTFIEWQSVYPQNIPAGYVLEYVGDRAYGQQSIEWKNQEDDWYSYVRRWYYDKTNNNQVYFTYETYSTDCNTEQEVLKLFVPAFTEAEFASIQGYPAITLQDEHRAHVAWMIGDINKGVSFQLYSEQFTVEELLKMAESVQKQ